MPASWLGCQRLGSSSRRPTVERRRPQLSPIPVCSWLLPELAVLTWLARDIIGYRYSLKKLYVFYSTSGRLIVRIFSEAHS
mmetsp:Transcript_496/g.1010  ORF Transcript_496/g.1010 Transcript_496/m.1010 type:complete len:81 (-) Transcript_496:77-319(-)